MEVTSSSPQIRAGVLLVSLRFFPGIINSIGPQKHAYSVMGVAVEGTANQR